MAVTKATVTYKLTEPNGRVFYVRGTAGTQALAEAEANAKLALISGTSVVKSISTQDDAPTAAGHDDDYSDAVLVLRKGLNSVAIRVDNMSNSYALAGTPGKIDMTNAAVVAFATAYRDGSGAGGYTIESAEYVA